MTKTHNIPRADAVTIGTGTNERDYVPTSAETKWVSTIAEFHVVGGFKVWNEDQTEITLALPAGHKFSIAFTRKVFGE